MERTQNKSLIARFLRRQSNLLINDRNHHLEQICTFSLISTLISKDGKILKELETPAVRCMLVKGSHLFIGQDWYQWSVYDLVAEKTIVPDTEWEPVQCMSTDGEGKLYLCSSFSENISVWAPVCSDIIMY